MTDDIDREIARCEEEMARMAVEGANAPAYLVTMGMEDWHREKTYLLAELKDRGGVVLKVERSMSRPHVTTRELEVLDLLADGFNAAQIAERLGMKHGTAETHRRHLLAKFGEHSTPSLVRHAIRIGLIDA